MVSSLLELMYIYIILKADVSKHTQTLFMSFIVVVKILCKLTLYNHAKSHEEP